MRSMPLPRSLLSVCPSVCHLHNIWWYFLSEARSKNFAERTVSAHIKVPLFSSEVEILLTSAQYRFTRKETSGKAGRILSPSGWLWSMVLPGAPVHGSDASVTKHFREHERKHNIPTSISGERMFMLPPRQKCQRPCNHSHVCVCGRTTYEEAKGHNKVDERGRREETALSKKSCSTTTMRDATTCDGSGPLFMRRLLAFQVWR